MSEPVRVMVQMKSNPSLAAAAFGRVAAAPPIGIAAARGVHFDSRFSPVPVPPKRPPGAAAAHGPEAAAVAFSPGEQSSYVVRATVAADAIQEFVGRARQDPQVVGVFADPKIQPIAAVCPLGPVGTDLDVEQLLLIDELRSRGMDGAGVRVVIVDTGVNLQYLSQRGKNPAYDAELSWGPSDGLPLGDMPVDHGTMCAYDVCIAAPNCTLADHALLTSTAPGGSMMDGFLSDAVASYGVLLSWMSRGPSAFAGDHLPRTLVVNNSWGMFHPSWDFPVGDPGNYSDNPAHPFNIIVASLEAAGADILFAAGNCGAECPDGRCEGLTNAGIFGANSSEAVLSIAGVIRSKERIGYSTQGPGRLHDQKPDIASFTHFAGSGVYSADGGTSAATPVAAGVVAAIRRAYPSSVLPPAQLRDLLRQTAESPDGNGFNYDYGHGVINVAALLDALDALPGAGGKGDKKYRAAAAAAALAGRNGNGRAAARAAGPRAKAAAPARAAALRTPNRAPAKARKRRKPAARR